MYLRSENLSLIIIIVALLFSCSRKSESLQSDSLEKQMVGQPHLAGKKEYLNTPYVTAGDRVYMVGHQDGTFPDLGWHIGGEMGGIWDHPIKLMDGFEVSMSCEGVSYCLQNADCFVNYPFANKHHFVWHEQQLEIERFQFAPDQEEGLVIEFTIHNKSSVKKVVSLAVRCHFDLRPVWLGDRTGMANDADEVQYLDKRQVLLGKDKTNPWFAVAGSRVPVKGSSLEFTGCDQSGGKESTAGTVRY
ncbi:MAG TPA: hypothetical protein VG737_17330, partial [Cyclobacteriaceae bacterium]|nr:hypothetical protein [Cyclobacteriaceae bacterium]